MTQTTVKPALFQTGFRLVTGESLNDAITGGFGSVTDGIVATPNGTVSTSLVLRSRYNRVTSAATSGAVRLPPAIAGTACSVRNDDASNALTLFPYNATDAINAAGAGNSVSIAAAGKQAAFVCYTTGTWIGPVAAV